MQAAMCALPELNQLYVELEIFGYRKRIEFNFTFFENVLFEKWTPEFESLVKQAAEHFKEDLTKELITLYKETYSKILHI